MKQKLHEKIANAIEHENNKLVEQIINDSEFDVNYMDDDGHTPLIIAVRSGNKWAVETLLSIHDIDINKSEGDYSALMHSADHTSEFDDGRQSIARILMSHPGIDINYQKKDNLRTALILAVTNSRPEFVSIALSHPGIDVSLRDMGGKDALYYSQQPFINAGPKIKLELDAFILKKEKSSSTQRGESIASVFRRQW